MHYANGRGFRSLLLMCKCVGHRVEAAVISCRRNLLRREPEAEGTKGEEISRGLLHTGRAHVSMTGSKARVAKRRLTKESRVGWKGTRVLQSNRPCRAGDDGILIRYSLAGLFHWPGHSVPLEQLEASMRWSVCTR